MKYTPEQHAIAFWNKIAITANDNQCWLWTGSFFKNGYGYHKLNKKKIRSHRLAWSYPDYVIPDGMYILHSCDNRSCCNPKHLFLGTHQDNMDDMIAKGRQASPEKISHKGEANGNSKLTMSIAREIRLRFEVESISKRQLAREYSVSDTLIGYIVIGKIWQEPT